MKAFKGFDEKLQCNPNGKPFQYEIGKEYEHEGEVKPCSRGFHACTSPLDVLWYYPPSTSRYCEVEVDDDSKGDNDDSKVASKKIKIGAEIGVFGLAKAHIEYVKEHVTHHVNENDSGAATAGEYGAATAGDSGAATAGRYGAATAGDRGAATAGDRGAATAGNRGAATAGYSGAATAGYSGAATAGNRGAATAGRYGAATAGDSGAATAGYSGAATAGRYGAATAGEYGAATAGEYGAATSRGKSATGDYGLSVARGNGVKVKGGLNAVLVIAEESIWDCEIKDWKAVVVDGEKIKADTWYKLENGELVEVKK